MKVQMPRIKKKVVSCFPCIYFLFTCCFQSAYTMEVSLKQQQSQRAFLEAVASNDPDLIRKALDENPDLDPDTKIIEGRSRGATALWTAAAWGKNNIVEKMLQKNPRANIESAPMEGVDRGVTVLWIAADRRQWDIVRTMMQNNPRANFETTPLEGTYRGVTVLWHAAISQEWDIIRTILQNNPRVSLECGPQEWPLLQGKTIKDLISENAPESLLKMMLLQYFYYHNGEGGFINPFPNSPRFQIQFEQLNKIFKRVRYSFSDFNSRPDPYNNICDSTHIINPNIPRDIRWLIAIRLLRVEDAEFKNHSDHVLYTIIMKFQGLYNNRDKNEFIADVIACGTLQQLYPTQENSKNPQGGIIYDKNARSHYRTLLKQIIFNGMIDGILPKHMNEEMRSKTVKALNSWLTHDIEKRLKAIDWNEVDVAQDEEEKESPRNLKKREREEIAEME